MCLKVLIQCSPFGIKQAEQRFVDGATLCVYSVDKAWKQKESSEFWLSDIPSGCACSLLGNGVDRDAGYWALRTEILPLFEETLRRFCELSPDGFKLQALWTGEEPTETIDVTMNEMRRIVRANCVGKKCSYQVK